MRLGHARVTGVELHVDMVHERVRRLEVLERLLGVQRRQRDHVHGTDEPAIAVVRQERTGRQSRRVDVQAPHTGDEVGEIDQRRDWLERGLGRALRLRVGGSGERQEAGGGQSERERGAHGESSCWCLGLSFQPGCPYLTPYEKDMQDKTYSNGRR